MVALDPLWPGASGGEGTNRGPPGGACMPVRQTIDGERVPVLVYTDDIGTVMANQTDLVETVHELRQIVCVKG